MHADDYEEVDVISMGSFRVRGQSPSIAESPDQRLSSIPDVGKRTPSVKLPALPPLNSGSLKHASPKVMIIPKRTAPKPPKRSQTFHLSSSAPTLPPKPKPKPMVKSASLDQSELNSPNSEFEILPEELTLAKLAEKHQHSLPMRVRVFKGFYGYSDKTSLSEGDIFNVHFVKKSTVVNIVDDHNGKYKIALNSAIQFGIIFDPNNNLVEALHGYMFATVADLLEQKHLPKVVRANTAWTGQGASNSVAKNEVLALRGVRKLGAKMVKAYSITASMKKVLPESCAGNFSTKPHDVRLFMMELVNHIKKLFPCKCSFFGAQYESRDVPTFSGAITLESSTVDSSLIATSAYGNEEDGKQIVEIPVDLDVEVQIMKPKLDSTNAQLYEDTRSLFEKFNPTQVQQCISDPVTNVNNHMQVSFYSYVREGNELAGIDLVEPMGMYSHQEDAPIITASQKQGKPPASSPTHPPKPTRGPLPSDNQELEQRPADKAVHEARLADVTTQQADLTKLSRELTSAKADIRRVEGRSMKTFEDITELRKEIAEISVAVEKLLGWSEGLQCRMDALSQKAPLKPDKEAAMYQSLFPAATGNGESEDFTSQSCTVETNKHFLTTLSNAEVLGLLDTMDLSQYREVFKSEQVNGDLLLECDDDVLKGELKMTSKLHRLRLMKVVNGKHSAERILKGEDPYAYC